jgi:ABC-type transport system substrate-binding protein
MLRLRFVVTAAFLVAVVGVFTVSAQGDPVPPVRVAIGPMGNGSQVGSEFDLANDGGSLGSWQIAYADCAKLVNYPDAAPPAGGQLQPDAATSLPTILNDGLTYTFTIRSGLGFSPPSSEQVTPGSFVVAIERFEKLNQLGYRTVLDAIQGAAAYRAGSASSISGLSVSGDQLTMTLTKKDPVLLAKLTLPMFCAVPVGTSLSAISTTPLPSAGPYYVDPASVTRNGSNELTSFTLLRNPNYGGSRPAVLPELDFTVQTNENASTFADDSIAGAEASPPTMDVVAVGAPASERAQLWQNYGPGSAPANAGEQQYFEGPADGTQYIVPNTTRPGLGDVRVRQALDYAVDRNTAASLFFADPTDQLIAPAFPGFADYSIYPFSSDYATAQTLMQQAGYGPTHRLALTLVTSPGNQARIAMANDLATRLQNIYIDLTVQTIPNVIAYVSNPANLGSWDLFPIAWLPDYLDGSDVLGPIVDGRLLGTPGSVDYGQFHDPAYNAEFDYAASLDPGAARDAAWVNLDRDLMANDAPVIPVADLQIDGFFSTRVGCQVFNPIYGIDFGRLCERTSVAAGGTYSTGSGTTASDPVQTSVTSPQAGSVSVTSGPGATSVTGYNLLGSDVSVQAPVASAGDPLSLSFELDPTLLASQGATVDSVTVFRNGAAVADCSTSDGTATPDPCVSSRTTELSGDALITVLTSHASEWNFGQADSTPPTLDSEQLSANQVFYGNPVTLSVSTSSDATAAEFYVDHDNGAGLNLPLEGGAGSFTSKAFGWNLPVGTHTIGVRASDAAGNWTSVQTVQLVVSPHVVADFNGDGKTDAAFYLPADHTWHINGQPVFSFGVDGAIPVPGDYNGDGSTEAAFFNPANNRWYIKGQSSVWWGGSNVIPVPGDYTGNGKTELAYYKPANRRWYLKGQGSFFWGEAGVIPVPGDYNGDGETDLAYYNPSNHTWHIHGQLPFSFGVNGAIPVPGDYNGDGTTDAAFFNPANDRWFIRGHGSVLWGGPNVIPVPGDYNGDGTTDPAYYQPSDHTWHVFGQATLTFGVDGAVPLALPSAIYDPFFTGP